MFMIILTSVAFFMSFTALDEEREKREGARRQVEAEKKMQKDKKAARKANSSKRTPQKEEREKEVKPSREDKEREKNHRAFMQKVEKVVEKERTKEKKREEKERKPVKPKSSSKAAPIPKKPMSYEELLKFAADQRKGNVPPKDVAEESASSDEYDDEEEEEYEAPPRQRERNYDNHSKNGQIQARLKEEAYKKLNGVSRRDEQRSSKSAKSQSAIPDKNRTKHLPSNQNKSSKLAHGGDKRKLEERKTASKVDDFRKKGVSEDRVKSHKVKGDKCMNGKISSTSSAKVQEKGKTGSGAKPTDRHQVNPSQKTGRPRDSPGSSDRPHSGSRDGPHPKPSDRPGSRPGPSGSRPSDRLQGRPGPSDRDRPRPSGMGPPRFGDVPRKRPGKVKPG